MPIPALGAVPLLRPYLGPAIRTFPTPRRQPRDPAMSPQILIGTFFKLTRLSGIFLLPLLVSADRQHRRFKITAPFTARQKTPASLGPEPEQLSFWPEVNTRTDPFLVVGTVVFGDPDRGPAHLPTSVPAALAPLVSYRSNARRTATALKNTRRRNRICGITPSLCNSLNQRKLGRLSAWGHSAERHSAAVKRLNSEGAA